MKITENGQTANETTQAMPETTATGIAPVEKVNFMDAGVKATILDPEVQKAIRHCVYVPDVVIVKKVRKPFKPDDAEQASQTIEGIGGTSLDDAFHLKLSLVGMELNPEDAINKKFRIIDCTVGLTANMKEAKFIGYAATGFKLTVTKMEEIK